MQTGTGETTPGSYVTLEMFNTLGDGVTDQISVSTEVLFDPEIDPYNHDYFKSKKNPKKAHAANDSTEIFALKRYQKHN